MLCKRRSGVLQDVALQARRCGCGAHQIIASRAMQINKQAIGKASRIMMVAP
jgi:hypothetical protein